MSSKVINGNSTATGFKPVTHCIFDMDGLLLDTENIYEKIIGNIAKSFGHPYPWETRMRILGSTERRSCEIAVQELELPCTVDDFQDKFQRACIEKLQNVFLLKGAERLLRHLHEKDIPICLATSSSRKGVELKTNHHQELFKFFKYTVTGTDTDVKAGKPAPDVFLCAASRFPDNPLPEHCLVFEDSPNGCKAAKLANMQVVMVPDSHLTKHQKRDATLVIHSLLDFKPEDFGLPPFEDESPDDSSE